MKAWSISSGMGRAALAIMVLAAGAGAAEGQLVETVRVGADGARMVLDAAQAEARRNGWSVSIAVVDPAGQLVAFARGDDAHHASIDLALGKARTAARFRRPSKEMEDRLATRPAFLAVEGIVPIEGGIPILVDGKVVGAIGVSGVTSQQDAQIAAAGAAAIAARKP